MGNKYGWSKSLTDPYGKTERKYFLPKRKLNRRAGMWMLQKSFSGTLVKWRKLESVSEWYWTPNKLALIELAIMFGPEGGLDAEPFACPASPTFPFS